MNLYLISQEENCSYDTFDSAVVAAENEQDARLITPDGHEFGHVYGTWCSSPERVTVEFLCSGYEGEAGVILASFNAG